MPITAAQRMANLRARQRALGLVSISLVVPASDALHFHRLASSRRETLNPGRGLAKIRSSVGKNIAQEFASHRIKPDDIMETRVLLEVAAVGLVIRRMNPLTARRMRSLIIGEARLDGDARTEDLQKFHLALGELSGDPALLLFLRLALQLTDEHSTFRHRPKLRRDEVVSRLKMLHSSIADAIIVRDQVLAVKRMRRYLSGLKDWLR